MATILIAGGLGRLARALWRETVDRHYVVALGRENMDISIEGEICAAMDRYGPDAVINCAGLLSLEAEMDHEKAWAVNVVGAAHLARHAAQRRARLVHISTDYVFGGDGAPYRESDPPDPINYYGFTKAAGEAAVLAVNPEALVLRAPFRYDGEWPYPRAFQDQFISGRWLSEVAPDIAIAALDRTLTGVLHIGGARKCVYDLAREASPEVTACHRADCALLRIPRDTTLDSSRWRERQSESKESLAAR